MTGLVDRTVLLLAFDLTSLVKAVKLYRLSIPRGIPMGERARARCVWNAIRFTSALLSPCYYTKAILRLPISHTRSRMRPVP